jgi:periplasmic protein TonB
LALKSNFKVKNKRISWTQNAIFMKSILLLFLLLSTWSLKAQTDTTQISKADSVVYHNPEIEPEFPGGQAAWMRYLLKNLRYPERAQPGTVVIQFWVDSNGFSHDMTVISGPKELREESVRIIKNVKIWTPAVVNGKKANAWKTQLIMFEPATQ